jgi:hypothetical protein
MLGSGGATGPKPDEVGELSEPHPGFKEWLELVDKARLAGLGESVLDERDQDVRDALRLVQRDPVTGSFVWHPSRLEDFDVPYRVEILRRALLHGQAAAAQPEWDWWRYESTLVASLAHQYHRTLEGIPTGKARCGFDPFSKTAQPEFRRSMDPFLCQLCIKAEKGESPRSGSVGGVNLDGGDDARTSSRDRPDGRGQGVGDDQAGRPERPEPVEDGRRSRSRLRERR